MKDSVPKYKLAQQYIEDAIRTKQFVYKLPGERALAKEFGFSYMTVRKAVDILVSQGVLYKVATRGTFINGDRDRRRRKTNRTIGYFLDTRISMGIASPYYSMIFDAIEKEASDHGLSLVYFTERSEDQLQTVLSKMDGVIATCFPRNEGLIGKIKSLIPVVLIENSATDKSIPSVVIKNYDAIADCVDYLRGLDHENIGFISGLLDSEIGTKRLEGYMGGLEKNAISYDESLIYRGDYSFESGVRGADFFLQLDCPPTALICANDSMALGAVKRLRDRSVAVPDRISVVGFDDIEVASQISPALTTIAAPVEDIARLSFAMLMALVEGDGPEVQHMSLPARLVKRQTCRSPASPVAA